MRGLQVDIGHWSGANAEAIPMLLVNLKVSLHLACGPSRQDLFCLHTAVATDGLGAMSHEQASDIWCEAGNVCIVDFQERTSCFSLCCVLLPLCARLGSSLWAFVGRLKRPHSRGRLRQKLNRAGRIMRIERHLPHTRQELAALTVKIRQYAVSPNWSNLQHMLT